MSRSEPSSHSFRNDGTVAPAPPHVRKPDRDPTKKGTGDPALLRLFSAVLAAGTEFKDLLDAAWKAVDKKYIKDSAQAMGKSVKELTLVDRFDIVLNAISEDAYSSGDRDFFSFETFFKEAIKNEIVDQLMGRLTGAAQEASPSNRPGFNRSLTWGPAGFGGGMVPAKFGSVGR